MQFFEGFVFTVPPLSDLCNINLQGNSMMLSREAVVTIPVSLIRLLPNFHFSLINFPHHKIYNLQLKQGLLLTENVSISF